LLVTSPFPNIIQLPAHSPFPIQQLDIRNQLILLAAHNRLQTPTTVVFPSEDYAQFAMGSASGCKSLVWTTFRFQTAMSAADPSIDRDTRRLPPATVRIWSEKGTLKQSVLKPNQMFSALQECNPFNLISKKARVNIKSQMCLCLYSMWINTNWVFVQLRIHRESQYLFKDPLTFLLVLFSAIREFFGHNQLRS
jgi:hypothetical protein